MLVNFSTPAGFGKVIPEDTEKWAKVISSLARSRIDPEKADWIFYVAPNRQPASQFLLSVAETADFGVVSWNDEGSGPKQSVTLRSGHARMRGGGRSAPISGPFGAIRYLLL